MRTLTLNELKAVTGGGVGNDKPVAAGNGNGYGHTKDHHESNGAQTGLGHEKYGCQEPQGPDVE